ncbi:MAG: hypothetical protein KDB80_04385 [Planctomycetes bacterium]|nr:hypothetical protein [Planctomycetota bacterium]
MRCLALSACILLQSCAVTTALWADPEPSVRPDRLERAPCEVLAVHGSIDPDPAATRLELLLTQPDAKTEIGHVRRWTDAHPGCVALKPSPFERDWLFAATDRLSVESWDVEVFGGETFAARGSFNARVTLTGTMPADVVGRFLDEPIHPTEKFGRNTLADDWEMDALAALDEHDWSTLLGGPAATAKPVAWIERDGTTHAYAPRDRDASEFDLVVTFRDDDGGTRQARIPAAMLAGSLEQRLSREGDHVAWRYSAVWSARHTSPTDAPTFAVGNGPARIAYEWSYIVPEPDPTALSLAGKVALTPFAMALDVLNFVVETSPPLKRLKDFILDRDRDRPDPIPPLDSMR